VSVHSVRGRVARHLSGRRTAALRELLLFIRGVLFVGRRHVCPCCGWRLRGFVGRWGAVRTNCDGYCPRCNAKARHRRLWRHMQALGVLDGRPVRLLDVAPWPSLAQQLRRLPAVEYVGVDLRAHGRHVDVIGNAESLPVRSGAFDVILCTHVLEHLDDDRRAMRELRRALHPDGVAVVSVPLRLDRPTHEDPSITDPAERAKVFGERGHVRLYGTDLRDRLEAAGFTVEVDWATAIEDSVRRRCGLRTDEHLFVCAVASDVVVP
jgi:SAM-dependent methyltransferase